MKKETFASNHLPFLCKGFTLFERLNSLAITKSPYSKQTIFESQIFFNSDSDIPDQEPSVATNPSEHFDLSFNLITIHCHDAR